MRLRRSAILLVCAVVIGPALIGASRRPRQPGPALATFQNPLQVPVQTPAPTPRFTGKVDIVRVNVEVIDNKTGKPVTGLTESDFTVTENGAPQKITAFATESETATSKPSTAAVSTASAVETIGSPTPGRVFLIMIGHANPLGSPVEPAEGVITFLRGPLLPTDRVALLMFNRVTPFTTDHEALARVVEQFRKDRTSIVTRLLNEHQGALGTRTDITPGLQDQIDALLRPVGSPRSVTMLLFGTAEMQREDRTWRAWNRMVIYHDLLKVLGGIEYLRHAEGEKHLISLTTDLTLPSAGFINGFDWGGLITREDDLRLAARANDAQVALDIIDLRGTFRGSAFWIMSGKNVAEYSGGQFSSTWKADKALRRIEEATRNSYVLGYVPANSALDGKYRNIAVKVNRKNVTVMFPHGYTARADAPPIDVREVMTRLRLRTAAATDAAQNNIGLQAKASIVPGGGAAGQVRVELTIDASRLSLTQEGANRRGIIDLLIVCGDAKRNVVGALNQQMFLSLDEEHYQQAMKTGIPYVTTVPVTAAPAFLKALVYDYDADRLGAATVTIPKPSRLEAGR